MSRRLRFTRFIGCLVAALLALVAGCSVDAERSPVVTGSRSWQDGAEPVEVSVSTRQEQGAAREAAAPLADRSAGGATLFTRLTPTETGVDFDNPLDLQHPLKRLYISGFATGGVAIGDVDGDGLPDLFLASGPRVNRLYRQRGNLQFEEVTRAAGLKMSDVWSAGAAFADMNNDGHLDLFVCNYEAPCQLYINDGTGRFSERAAAAGVDVQDACLMAYFCDYDGDGHLDLFVLTNRFYRAGGRPQAPPVDVVAGVPVVREAFQRYYGLQRNRDGSYHIDTIGRPNYLFRNNGDGTFTDETRAAGIQGAGHGLSATWWDYNGDGLPDLYVANDFDDPDQLYRNNGDGTFTDVLVEAAPHTSWFSMGSDAADLNGDGRLDLLVADMSARSHFAQKTTMGAMNAEKLAKVAGPPPQIMKNSLFLGSGTPRLFEAAELAGLADTDWTWAVKLADFDNDGLVDVVVTNGISRSFNDSDIPFRKEMLIGRTEWSLYEDTPPRKEANVALANRGDLQFADVSQAWGFNHLGMSYACAYGDLDRDGDLDLVVVNLDETVSIYRNDSTDGRRLLVSLVGADSNRFGIGAIVTAETASGRQVRMLSPQTGFLSSNEPLIHFGLGDATQVDRLTIDWPSGTRQVLRDVAADQWLTVREADAVQSEVASDGLDAQPRPMFTRVDRMPAVRHREEEFDDFARQPLLPNKLSQLGPGLAVADANGDGLDDAYLGGARGQAGTLLLGRPQGGFQRVRPAAFDEDLLCEDMGAVWINADGDGDLDLYVVSGGVECEPGADVLRDRLYLNNGNGEFTKAPPGMLPDLTDSGSVVCAADFDRDGDVDLFVGSRVIPGQYPAAPPSRLLENRGGAFVDVTEQRAPELLTAGLVTGAVWSDVNGDGWIDLLVTTEWGPVRLFLYQQGKLVEATTEAGLAARTGWWNGIAARDLDGDGHIDYVVTNFGLNTKYHASREQPVVLYYGDFDGSGVKRLVEAEYEDETLFPIRGKSCSTTAMPHLADKFSTYREFALASVADIYTPQCLSEADRFECNTLETGVLWNDGQGHFEFEALPWLAQISPSFGVLVTDVNGDGWPDIYLAQNFFTPQPETGRMDSGMSLLLLGSQDRKFEPVTPDVSGLIVTGDATAAVRLQAGNGERQTLLIGVNNDAPLAFERLPPMTQEAAADRPRRLHIKLDGGPGNPAAYGARIDVLLTNGLRQAAEVAAGDGYLSQSSHWLDFAVPAGSNVERIVVRWPDGAESTHEATGEPVQTLTKP